MITCTACPRLLFNRSSGIVWFHHCVRHLGWRNHWEGFHNASVVLTMSCPIFLFGGWNHVSPVWNAGCMEGSFDMNTFIFSVFWTGDCLQIKKQRSNGFYPKPPCREDSHTEPSHIFRRSDHSTHGFGEAKKYPKLKMYENVMSELRSGYSSRTLEIKSVPIPAPVPPPREWQSWKPCKPGCELKQVFHLQATIARTETLS